MSDKEKAPLGDGANEKAEKAEAVGAGPIVAQSPARDNGHIEALAEKALDVHPAQDENPAQDEKKRETQAEIILRLASPAELFRSPKGEAFATFPANGHRETAPLREMGGRFRKWLTLRFYEEQGRGPATAAITDAMRALEAMAEFGEVREVYQRVAEHGDALYIDLANNQWEAVKVTGEGWEITKNPPVRFVRTRGMLPLPTPERGGKIEELGDFLNVQPASKEWLQIVGWLIGAYNARGPYVHLALYGEQGTAKSTAAKVLRRLTDPNRVDLRQPPKEEKDLAVMARHNRVVALDNLSYLQGWLSDALARMATGGGVAGRMLYTDGEEMVIETYQPAILTSITEVVTRGDLLDRLVVVTLDPIPENKRKQDRLFWADFEVARPRIFGAVLDALVAAMRNRENVNLATLPRMADHVVWVEAAAPVLGWERGQYATMYTEAQRDAVAAQLESHYLATVLMDFADEKAPLTLPSGKLLKALEEHLEKSGQDKPKSWPASPHKLTGELRRLAPGLRQAGYNVQYVKHRRAWRIEK